MTLPSESAPWPFASEVMAVTSSGSEVPFFMAITLQMIYATNMARRIRPTGREK
ncbi:Uncharacterised protein [Alistipes sp. cv1]|nr:Uncharacterised protein [Faecalibacterium prausnitzii]